MCGRYVIARALGDLMAASGADNANFEELQPDYNVAPTKNIPVVVEHYQQPRDPTTTWERNLYLARWGLVPSWAKDLSFGQRTFNARAETVVEKPSFRSAVKSRRAAIPVDGYYEWLAPQTKGERKQPYYVRPKDGSPIFFAGLYEWWKDPIAKDDAAWVLSATMLTGASPDAGAQPAILDDLSGLHHRLPLPMSSSMMDEWLSAGEVTKDEAAHLVDAVVAEAYDVASTWEMYPVAPAVGSVANNGPELIEPFEPGQDSLL
ncbi:SOS response-associated peptidase [Yaniella halotolerans]|uniref:SOS response-associated peptidase n=1 Tax=Yaniella halotolerans TaxID=225453 RepID=UPI0003B713F0|nr:SOS response-associated peptidase [Yaniella halotolerans]